MSMIKATINRCESECHMNGTGVDLVAECVCLVRTLFTSLRHDDPPLAMTFQTVLTEEVTTGNIFGNIDGEVIIDLEWAKDIYGN